MTMKEEYTAIDMATAAADGFRAGQRAAQSAGVPDGERLAELLESVRLGDEEAKPHGSGATYWNNAVLACQVAIRDALAAAPAQPAAQGEFGDAYQGAREDLAIWKRRALEAEQKVRHQEQIIDRLTLEAQGEARFGEPHLPAAGSADLTAVRCQCCATEYPHDSYDAGFIAGSGMCQVCDAAMPPKDLPAAGSAVEEVEVVAWMWRDLNGDMQFNYMHPEGQGLMTVAQHERIVAALSAQQSAQPEFCCEHSYKVAKQAAWGACDLTQCKCDHNEYCEHCWPDDFREGGKWHGGFETKQSAPELVSVPVELAERIATHLEWDGEESLTVVQYANKCDALAGELRALLASHAEGGKV